MNVFELAAKLTLDSSGYDSGLSGAMSGAKTFGGKLKTALSVGAAAFTAVTTAAVGAGKAIFNSTNDIAAFGDNIDKMSQKMGLSAEAYQEWDAIMQHSGTSIESLQSGMKTLANAVESGNKAFGRLGITQEQIAAMNNEELFSATITALQNVENETERTYLAGQLLGRGATELGALLNTSAEETEAMRQRVHELGGVMSDDAVKASARYKDSLQDLTTAFSGFKRGMVADFLPAISDVMDGLTELFAGGDGMEQITQGIEGIANGISEAAPRILEVGSRIILSLGEAVTANLPVLIEAGTNAVLTLTTGLVEQLPAIVDAGLQVIVSLANGIAENLPELIPTIVDVVLQIVDTLTSPETLISLLQAAIQLMVALANGLIQAIPQLIGAIPQIISNLVGTLIAATPQILSAGVQLIVALAAGLIGAIPQLVATAPELIVALVGGIVQGISTIIETGGQLVSGFLKGITDAWDGMVKNVVRFFTGFIDTIKGLFGIHSPSTVFAGIGENIIEGLINGIKGLASSVASTAESIASTITGGITKLASSAINWGRDLMDNFIGGIKAKFQALKDAVSNVAQTVKDFIGFSEPEKGPLSHFHTYAPDMMKLFAQGIRDNEHLVADQLEKSFDFTGESAAFGVTASASRSVTYNHTGTIRVEGVNSEGEFMASMDIIYDDIVGRLRREARYA